MRAERGSALITVILVVFVLTMVGIAGVLYMTMEDKLSGNDKLTQTALYAAEMGLRVGETQVRSAMSLPAGADGLLTGSTVSYDPPGGGYTAVSLGTLYYQQPVALPTGVPGTVTYSLYVRNNGEDPAPASATHDNDLKINLIAVGTVSGPSGRSITKVLEEQMFIGGAGGGERLMKGGNIGGTGAAGMGASG